MRREWMIYTGAGIVLLGLLLLGFSLYSGVQTTTTRSDHDRYAEAPREVIPTRIPPRAFRHNIKIEEKYDKFLGINSIDTEKMIVAGTYPEAIQMSPMFAFKGDKERGSFMLTFIVVGKYASMMEHSNPDVRRLFAVADGQRIDLGILDVADSMRSVYVLTTPFIPNQTFLQLVSAKEVEMSLGGQTFGLTEEQLEAMRDVASRATN